VDGGNSHIGCLIDDEAGPSRIGTSFRLGCRIAFTDTVDRYSRGSVFSSPYWFSARGPRSRRRPAGACSRCRQSAGRPGEGCRRYDHGASVGSLLDGHAVGWFRRASAKSWRPAMPSFS